MVEQVGLDGAEVLAGETTPDQAIMLYVRTFNLSSIDAQVVFRTAMSQWAELHPLAGEAQAQVRPPAAALSDARSGWGLRARPEFGLRVMS